MAIEFFGLGTGYFVWGGQALFDFPKSSPDVNRTMGMWGLWIAGFPATTASIQTAAAPA